MDKCIGCRGCKKAKKVNKEGGKQAIIPCQPTHSSPLARLAKTPRLVCATLHNLPFMNNTNGVTHAHHGEQVDYHDCGMAHIGIVRIQAWVQMLSAVIIA